MSQSILVNTTAATGGRIINIALGVVITAAVTRLLGVSNYGLYALIVSLGTMLQIASDFGLYLTLTRDLGSRPGTWQKVYGTIVSLRLLLLGSLFILGIGVLALWPQYSFLLPSFLMIAVGLVFQSISQLLMGVYQAEGTAWRATIGDFIGRLVQLVIVLVLPLVSNYQLLVTSYKLQGIAAAFALGAGTALAIHSLLVTRVKPWKLTVSKKDWRSIARQSWPLGALLLLNVIYFRVDIVMLSFWHPGEHVGWYGLAYRIVESALFFPAMFGGLLLPHISRSLSQNKLPTARRLLEQSLHLITVSAFLVGMLYVSFAKPIVVFLSGPDFLPAAPLLQILTIALVVMFFGNIFGFVLVAANKQMFLLKLYLCLVIVNIAGNAIFIPLYASRAAAWTTVVTECLAAAVAGYAVWKLIRYKIPLRTVGISAFTAIAAGTLALSLPSTWHVITRIIISTIFFTASSFALGILNKSRINHLLRRHEYV